MGTAVTTAGLGSRGQMRTTGGDCCDCRSRRRSGNGFVAASLAVRRLDSSSRGRKFDELHAAFRTIRRSGCGNLRMHWAGELWWGGLCAGGVNFLGHVEVKSRRGSSKRNEQEQADEIEMASDEFHNGFLILFV